MPRTENARVLLEFEFDGRGEAETSKQARTSGTLYQKTKKKQDITYLGMSCGHLYVVRYTNSRTRNKSTGEYYTIKNVEIFGGRLALFFIEFLELLHLLTYRLFDMMFSIVADHSMNETKHRIKLSNVFFFNL